MGSEMCIRDSTRTAAAGPRTGRAYHLKYIVKLSISFDGNLSSRGGRRFVGLPRGQAYVGWARSITPSGSERARTPSNRKNEVRRLTANFDGRFELEEHGLLHEDLPRDFAEKRNVLLADFDVAATRVAHLVDDRVDVEPSLHFLSCSLS